MAETQVTGARLVPIDELQRCVVGALERLNVPSGDAAMIAEILIDSDLRGYDDHGVAMLANLARYYQTGALNPRPNIQVVRETRGALLLDADKACGVIGATRAMQWCIERAHELGGMAVAGVRNTNHFIAAAPYVTTAAQAGLIGFACSNATPLMAPPGGLTRTFGTNPLAYGIPRRDGAPIVLDMATTAIAAAKVTIAAKDGRQMPDGAILDKAGRPSTDPNDFSKGGLMTPLGGELAGHKGFGLSMVVDVLAGVLTGGAFGADALVSEGKANQLFWALDVEAFLPRDEFLARIEQQIAHIKAGERLDGVTELLIPGERGQRQAADYRARGVAPLPPSAWEAFVGACASLGVAVPALA